MKIPTLLGTAVVAMALGGCASSASTHATGTHPSTAQSCPPVYFSTPPSASPGSNDLIGTINTIGREQFPSTYTGITSPGPGSFVISETQSNPAVIAAAKRVKGGDQVMYTEKIVPRSYVDLERIEARIFDDLRANKLDGLNIVSAGPDPDSDTAIVEVSVPECGGPTELSPALLSKLQGVFDARYGKGLVTVSKISVEPAGF